MTCDSVITRVNLSWFSAARKWWREQRETASWTSTLRCLIQIAWQFFRDSLPDRKRQRFGDIDYDWEHRVNTTSANVSWQARLIGLFNSSYQPIEPEIFREILNSLAIDFSPFTFIDIGSGKGRGLLLAAEYPFRRIIGIELLPELNEVAQENIRKFVSSDSGPIASICGDAAEFSFPPDPLVVFLFHPLPEAGFRKVITNLDSSLQENPREALVIYANPIFEGIVLSHCRFEKLAGTHLYSIFRRSVQPQA
jgi:SAM-dependent methyltransferase